MRLFCAKTVNYQDFSPLLTSVPHSSLGMKSYKQAKLYKNNFFLADWLPVTVALSCLCPNKTCISHLLSKAATGVLCSEAHMLNILMTLSVLKRAHVEEAHVGENLNTPINTVLAIPD